MNDSLYPANESVVVVASGNEIAVPRNRRLYDWWALACAGRRMPLFAAFDPVAFPWALGYLSVVRVLDDSDYRYRVDGTHVVEYFGVEMSRRKLSEYPRPIARQKIGDSFRIVRTAKAPVNVRRDVFDDGRSVRVDLLLLPFSDDGANVTEIMSCFARSTEASSS